MTLGSKRRLFTRLLWRLLRKACELGLHPMIEEVKRGKQQAEWNAENGLGIATSVHLQALAVDLTLFFSNGKLRPAEDYDQLGEWWEKQHHLCRWGGRFKRRDVYHFSVEHNGRM